MPRNRNRRRRRNRRGRGRMQGEVMGPRGAASTASTADDGRPLALLLQSVKATTSRALLKNSSAMQDEKEAKKDGWDLTEFRRGSLDTKEEPSVQLKLLRAVFKADVPYRCRLGLYVNMATSGAGLLNFSYNVNNVGSVAEWSAIDQLFDECFIHTMSVRFQPYNSMGGGGVGAAPSTTYGTLTTSAPNTSKVVSCGLIAVSLFHGATNYTSATAMLDNPTRGLFMSNEHWNYAWKNNDRFDPRGPAISDGTGISWQGWMGIANVSRLAGNIQIRAAADQLLGDQATAFSLGSLAVLFDLSFRARA